MIAVVKVLPKKQKNLRERLRLWWRRYPVEEAVQQSRWGPYCEIRVIQGKWSWNSVKQLCLSRRYKLLLPAAAQTEEDWRPDIQAYRRAVFESAFFSLLKNMNPKRMKNAVVLADQNGAYSSWIERIVPFCAVPVAVSEQSERYRQVREALLEEYGAVVLQTPYLQTGEGGVLLDPDGWLTPWMGFSGVVFSATGGAGKDFCFQIADDGDFPPSFDGIDRESFLAALWQENKTDLEHASFFAVRYGEKIPWGKTAQICKQALYQTGKNS